MRVSRQDLALMLGVKSNGIVRRTKCCLTKLALECSGALECGKRGETAWSTYRRATAPLLSDTQRTRLGQSALTELHVVSLLRVSGSYLFRCCCYSCGLGVCYEGARPLCLGCSLGSAGLVGHLCCQGGLSFWCPEIVNNRQQSLSEWGPFTHLLLHLFSALAIYLKMQFYHATWIKVQLKTLLFSLHS